MREEADRIHRDAQWGCEVPAPGAIVQHCETGRIYRVVENHGIGRTLDTLGDEGLLRYRIEDWFQYDVIQQAQGQKSPADEMQKPEGMELQPVDVAALEQMEKRDSFLNPTSPKAIKALKDMERNDPEYRAAISRAKKAAKHR